MWPFPRKKSSEDTSERVTNVEKRMLRMEEEWTEVYHKFRILQMRVAKQAQRIEQGSPTEEAVATEGGGGVETGTPPLSDRQRQFQLQILQRRNRAGGR